MPGQQSGPQDSAGLAAQLADSAVDLRAIVENLEDDILVPLLERSDILSQQCLDRDIVLKVAGQDGVELLEHPITVADLVGEYEWEWLGTTSALNQQVRAQQMVQGIALIAQIPPDQLAAEGVTVDWQYVLTQYWSLGLGFPNADRVLKSAGPKGPQDWRFENALARVNRAEELQVSPADDHVAHVQGHQPMLDKDILTDDAHADPPKARAGSRGVHDGRRGAEAPVADGGHGRAGRASGRPATPGGMPPPPGGPPGMPPPPGGPGPSGGMGPPPGPPPGPAPSCPMPGGGPIAPAPVVPAPGAILPPPPGRHTPPVPRAAASTQLARQVGSDAEAAETA